VPGPVDDGAIQIVVSQLSRPHRDGGDVIERAAILAAGTDSTEILAWIAANGGEPEALAPVASRGGLHNARASSHMAAATPRRYVFPPGVLR